MQINHFCITCSTKTDIKVALVMFMVLKIDGNSAIGAQAGSNLFYLICLKTFDISIAVKLDIFL